MILCCPRCWRQSLVASRFLERALVAQPESHRSLRTILCALDWADSGVDEGKGIDMVDSVLSNVYIRRVHSCTLSCEYVRYEDRARAVSSYLTCSAIYASNGADFPFGSDKWGFSHL